MMHRTQVYFEPEVLEALREEARKKKVTLARVIREKVVKSLPKKRVKEKKQMHAQEALLELAKHGFKGPEDLSQRIDEFVYKT